MKILIIEDEIPALNRIKKIVLEAEPNAEILGTADSIETGVELFKQFPQAVLALMDIELADGQSFEIFKRIDIKCPIIFTTAYDEFALKAFKVNSIDYLLKPIDIIELKNAFYKYKNRAIASNNIEQNIKQLLADFKQTEGMAFKDRFLVKSAQKLISISDTDIAYFLAEEKLCYIVTKLQHKYVVDYTLDELENILEPKKFFRLNRHLIASLASIVTASNYFNGKLKIELKPTPNNEVTVSRERASEFKTWLGG